MTGSEAFSGNYATLDSVSALMQKTGAGDGELGVQLVMDGEVV